MYVAGVLNESIPQDPISGMTLPHISILSPRPGLKVVLVLTVSMTRSPRLMIGIAELLADPSASSMMIRPKLSAARVNADVLNTQDL